MKKENKVALAIVGTVVIVGAGYYAYLHREEIKEKVDELKEEIKRKKSELGEAGSKKISKVVDKLIGILEKYSSGNHTEEALKEKERELKELKEELDSYKNS